MLSNRAFCNWVHGHDSHNNAMKISHSTSCRKPWPNVSGTNTNYKTSKWHIPQRMTDNDVQLPECIQPNCTYISYIYIYICVVEKGRDVGRGRRGNDEVSGCGWKSAPRISYLGLAYLTTSCAACLRGTSTAE